MARYCFYCGRALSSGEKCNCRSTGSSSADYTQSASSAGARTGSAGAGAAAGSAEYRQAAGAAGTGTGSTSSAGTARGTASGKARQGSTAGGRRSGQDNAFKRFFRAFNPFDSTPPRPRQARWSSRSAQSSSQAGARAGNAGSYRQTSRRAGTPINPQTILAGVRRLGTYLAQPADSIRQAAQAGNQRPVLVILVLQGVLGGLFLLMASNQAILRKLLDLSVTTLGQDGSFASRFFVFVQGFGISLTANLLLALIYQLALRFLFRQPTGYLRLLAALSPSCLYFGIFILAGLLSLPASFFSALMMLMAGIAMATVAQFLAARTITGFDDNRNFILVTLVMLIFTGVIAMLLNLSLPVLVAMLNSSTII